MPKHFKSQKSGSQANSSSTPAKRPKLYVLATKPTTPDEPQTTEWSLQLTVPHTLQNISASAPPSRSSSPRRQHKRGLLSHFSHKHKEETSVRNSSAPPMPSTQQEETLLPDNHYYFSRLYPDSFSVQRPTNTTLKIFLCSITPVSIPTDAGRRKSSATSTTIKRTDSNTLTSTLIDALSPVYATHDSTSWLRQALSALQIADIIPSVSAGLDINKFMGFATSFLEQHVRDSGNHVDGTALVKEVNYSKIARENARLRRMMSSDATDYAVVDAGAGVQDETMYQEGQGEGEDVDMWSTPIAQSKPQKRNGGKSWGGFWITYGSGGVPRTRERSGERHKREPWERSDPYGGLM